MVVRRQRRREPDNDRDGRPEACGCRICGSPQVAAVRTAPTSCIRAAWLQVSIVAVAGLEIGPETPIGSRIKAAGVVETSLDGYRLLLDEIAAPLLYVARDQIGAVVPYGIAGRSEVVVRLAGPGGTSSPVRLPIIALKPGDLHCLREWQGRSGRAKPGWILELSAESRCERKCRRAVCDRRRSNNSSFRPWTHHLGWHAASSGVAGASPRRQVNPHAYCMRVRPPASSPA
jgi:hypothetical protein